MPTTDPLSATFAALADPTRRAILTRLAQGEATVTELAEPFAMSLPAVSRHLRVLREAGLIVQGRAAQRRPCRIDPARLAQVDQWLAEYRDLWEARLDRLEAFLRRAPDAGRATATEASETETPRKPDPPGAGRHKEASP